MTSEKQKVLEMLECGKITPDQATKLLSVLDSKCKKDDFEQKMSGFEVRFETPHIPPHPKHPEHPIENLDDIDFDIEQEVAHEQDKEQERWENKTREYSEKVKGCNIPVVTKIALDAEKFGESIVRMVGDFGEGFASQFKTGNNTTIKNKKPTSKSFDDCKMDIKFTKGAFVFKGDFKLNEIDCLNQTLKPLVSVHAWENIEQLLKEQFVGDFKHIANGEVLKIDIG